RTTFGRSRSQATPHPPQKSGSARVSTQFKPPSAGQQVLAAPAHESEAPQRHTPSRQQSASWPHGEQLAPHREKSEEGCPTTQPPKTPPRQLCIPLKQALWSANAQAIDSPSTQFRTESGSTFCEACKAESLTCTVSGAAGCCAAVGVPVSLPLPPSN